MLERNLLSDRASDRASAYNNSSKIIRLDDRLLVGWLDAAEGAVGLSRVRLGVCSARSGSLRARHLLGEAWDNHCGPALALDGDRRLHVIVGGHHTPFRYLWTDDFAHDPASGDGGILGEDVVRWSVPEDFGTKDTYPSLIADPAGNLHLAYRQFADRWQLWYRRKPKGQPWEAPWCVAVSPVEGYNNFFHSVSTGPGGGLHLFFQFHYSLPGDTLIPGRFAAYLRSDDGGKTWFNEGAKCAFPLTTETTKFFHANPGGGLRIAGGHVVDSQDRPWTHVTTPDKVGGLLLRRDPGGWTEIDTTETLQRLNLQDEHGREISLTRSAAGFIHVVFATNPDAGPARWYDARHELYHLVLTEKGGTVSFGQITRTDPLAANWLPNLEKWDWTRRDETCADGPWLLYTRGLSMQNVWGGFRNSLRTELYLAHLDDPQGE